MSEPKQHNQTFKTGLYGLLTGLLFLEFFLFAWCRVQCVQTGYQVTVARQEAETLKDGQKELKAQLALLKNPARIMRIGKERLGLVIPGPGQVVVVK